MAKRGTKQSKKEDALGKHTETSNVAFSHARAAIQEAEDRRRDMVDMSLQIDALESNIRALKEKLSEKKESHTILLALHKTSEKNKSIALQTLKKMKGRLGWRADLSQELAQRIFGLSGARGRRLVIAVNRDFKRIVEEGRGLVGRDGKVGKPSIFAREPSIVLLGGDGEMLDGSSIESYDEEAARWRTWDWPLPQPRLLGAAAVVDLNGGTKEEGRHRYICVSGGECEGFSLPRDSWPL